jgi:hypothetical protein
VRTECLSLEGVVFADDGATASTQAPATKARADGAHEQDNKKDEKEEFDHE